MDIWQQPLTSAGLGHEIWQMNASGDAAFADLYDEAYRQATARGLPHALAQDAAMQTAKGGISSRHAMPDAWGDGRTINLGGGLQKPVYPGPPSWGFEGGSGLDPETARRARMTESLLVEARNQRLNPSIAGLMPQPVVARLNPQAMPIQGRAIGVDDGLGFDPLALAGGTTGANAAKIESTLAGLQQQPQQQGSGGPGLNPLDAGMMAADLASTALGGAGSPQLPLTNSASSFAPQPVVARLGLTRDALEGSLGTRAATAAPSFAPQPVVARLNLQPDVIATAGGGAAVPEPPNVSGGGAGTSTAKGNATIARQAARRGGGKGFLGTVDDFIARPGQSIGIAAEGGVRNVAAMAHKAGMPGTAGMLKGLAPAARWAAPVGLFAATTGLPAVMGAMEGNEKAGIGGGVLQGGGALAGAAIGQALIPIPVVGAGIGAMVGNAVGGGLTSGAQMFVEKAQQGDTGFMGGIGRALDPFIDTAYEKEQKAVQQQLNSPAMQAVRQQERARQERVRADQMEALLMQSYLR